MGVLRRVKNISMVLVVAVAMSLAGCADGDMATVRININLPDTVKVAYAPSLLDRFISFVTMSTPLMSDPFPGIGDTMINVINVSITGPDIAPINSNVDLSTGYIELDVPSGSDRKIEIRAGYESGELQWFFGNETNVNLIPGQVMSISPRMLGIPIIHYIEIASELLIDWGLNGNVEWDYPDEITSYHFEVQSASTITGPYSTIYSGDVSYVEGWHYFQPRGSVVEGDYVRIRVIYGEQKGLYGQPPAEVIPGV